MVEPISATNGTPDMFLPLFGIVFITAIKDLFEDIKRKRQDNEENTRKCNILEDGNFVEKKWQDIRVGEIIKVIGNEKKGGS